MGMLHSVFQYDNHEYCKKVLQSTDLIPRVSTLLLEDLAHEENG